MLGVHKRTIQRWCLAKKLPNAYRVGRSWRIPRRAVRDSAVARAMIEEPVERELRAATELCDQLRGELTNLANRRIAVLGTEPPPAMRDWRTIGQELAALETATDGL